MNPTRTAAAASNLVAPGSTAIAATSSTEAATAPPNTDFTLGFVCIRVAYPRNMKCESTRLIDYFCHFCTTVHTAHRGYLGRRLGIGNELDPVQVERIRLNF